MKIRLLCASLVLIATLLPAIPANAVAQVASNKPTKPLCQAQRGEAVCLSRRVYENDGVTPLSTVGYESGYRPVDLQTAYKLPPTPTGNFAWNGQTVAIVAAYDNPNAANDLLMYRKQFNLPLCATTKPAPTTNDLVGCFFKKVNQDGQSSPLPAPDIYWGAEIDIDIQMVAAVCPSCKILLVEAKEATLAELGKAVDRAAAMGATAISNSYGAEEYEGQKKYNRHYNHPGIAITASSGNTGYGVYFPAASQFVTAVGGTSLVEAPETPRGWKETVWERSASGCSAYMPRPSWQPSIGNCKNRITADVAAIGDPATGVAVYGSYGTVNNENWHVVGGTSVASPIIASIYALSGNTGKDRTARYNKLPYLHKNYLFDVTEGSNGLCTTNNMLSNFLLCNAGKGYDAPSGLGTPNGPGAF